MVDILISAEKLDLKVKGTHKFWALKSRLEILLEHITGVHADPNPAMGWFRGMKIAGTDIPHIFRAGLFWQDRDKVFWDVRHPKKTIVIELEDETCAKLIVEVKDPAAAVERIRQGIADYRTSKANAERELEQVLKGNLTGADGEDASMEPARLRQVT